jgi:rare lipoprotein A
MTRRRFAQIAAALALGAGLVPPTAGYEPTAAAPATDGTTIAARAGTLVDRAVTFRGHASGARVSLQLRSGRRWTTLASVRARRDGGWAAHWTPRHLGRFSFRAVAGEATAAVASSAPRTRVTVYLPTRATWFGPGLYGNSTACGAVLTRHTLGVAHRWLPCGTKVALLYRGRSVTVPVVDRGPYAGGVQWDLTAATARALHMQASSTIGALSLRGGR